MPSWLTSDELSVADPFIALLLIIVFVALLRLPRRGHEPITRTAINRQRRWCTSCGEQGVASPWRYCALCGEEQVEPFREGWDAL